MWKIIKQFKKEKKYFGLNNLDLKLEKILKL